MANQVYLTFYKNGQPLSHPLQFTTGDPVSTIQEFDHQVLYLGHEQFFARSPIRSHKPIRCMLSIEKVTPQLMQYLVTGEHFEKVQINWFHYDDKIKKETEYFRHLFEDVKIQHLRLILPDVKAAAFARYDHLAELSFRYRLITWTYLKGNLIVSDEWNKAYEEAEEEGEVVDLYADSEEETFEVTVPDENPPPENKVTLSNARFLPEEGKTDFTKKCAIAADIEFIGSSTNKKVTFKLFSIYKGKEQDMQHEVACFESGGKAEGEVTLFHNEDYFSDAEKDSTATVDYLLKASHPECAEVQSELLTLPYVKPITCQFVELPDVLFNTNSAVPCIDASEKLIAVVVGTLIYAHNNPEKEVVIYGHTDSSGETAFNMNLSELRCKTMKALLDNDQAAFAATCNARSNVEDYQTILSVLTKSYNWDCDPGAIDNQDGPKTQNALKNFQIDYNLFYDQSINEDGRINQQTWGAFFNVIRDMIWDIATKEIGETVPTINYVKGGIHPCGEKFAQDAYAKKGRKSKKDRRVEVVFNDPADPIADTPYVNTIVMEPIEIKAVPPSKLKGMIMWCSHMEKGKRIAKKGHTLEIVPDILVGDKVTLQAQPATEDYPVDWTFKGYKNEQLSGPTVKLPVSGFKAQAGDFILDFFTGNIRKLIPPQKISVKAVDDNSGSTIGKIAVFPANINTFEWNLKKKWSEVFELIEKIQNGCSFLGPEQKRLKFSKFEGKLTFSAYWKEDPTNNEVFLAASVKGGFQPLFGIQFRQPIPIKGIASFIPAKLLNYGANIEAFFAIGGNVALTVALERSGCDDFKGSGGVTGSLAGSLGIDAIAGNRKILVVSANIGTGVTASGQLAIRAEDKAETFKCEIEIESKWTGVKGAVSWSIFDGKWSGKHECVFVKDEILWKLKPIKIFPR